jgi:hypothetical protein
VRRGDFPPDYRCAISDDPHAVLMRGGSAIVDPLGRVLAGPIFDGELARAKFDFDVAGHYVRPDVFSLTVNEAPQPLVTPKASVAVYPAMTAAVTGSLSRRPGALRDLDARRTARRSAVPPCSAINFNAKGLGEA